MYRSVIAVFKSSQQTKEAIEEIQGESLANSCISVVVRTEYIHQGSFKEEIATELAYAPTEINLDQFNAWLIQTPPINVPDLGEVVAAGPLGNELLHHPKGQGLAEALVTYGLTEERAKNYENMVRMGYYLVLIQTEHEKVNSVANALEKFGAHEVEKWSKTIDHALNPAHY